MASFSTLLGVAIVAVGFSQTVQTCRAGETMVTKGHAFPPPAARAFCVKHPALCSTGGHIKSVALTPARKMELDAVNRAVNRRIVERRDPVTSGSADQWRVPTTQGDCEDIAILKKSELLKRGWPASTLLLTVATLGGEGHTVLTVRTDKGDLILDNRSSAIRDWSRTSYRYFARQSQSANGEWVRIGS
jgi:predicted transglutaminase-like cysteine proteinase